MIAPGIEEWPYRSGDPGRYAAALARAKAAAAAARLAEGIVLGADTIVVLDGDVLQKPAGPEDQAAMLARLSGRRHEVITGVAMVEAGAGRARWGSQATGLRLRPLGDQEIASYVAGGEGADKAGGYAIQGGGGHWLEALEGDYDNVVGLPMRLVRRLLPEGFLGGVGDQPPDRQG